MAARIGLGGAISFFAAIVTVFLEMRMARNKTVINRAHIDG